MHAMAYSSASAIRIAEGANQNTLCNKCVWYIAELKLCRYNLSPTSTIADLMIWRDWNEWKPSALFRPILCSRTGTSSLGWAYANKLMNTRRCEPYQPIENKQWRQATDANENQIIEDVTICFVIRIKCFFLQYGFFSYTINFIFIFRMYISRFACFCFKLCDINLPKAVYLAQTICNCWHHLLCVSFFRIHDWWMWAAHIHKENEKRHAIAEKAVALMNARHAREKWSVEFLQWNCMNELSAAWITLKCSKSRNSVENGWDTECIKDAIHFYRTWNTEQHFATTFQVIFQMVFFSHACWRVCIRHRLTEEMKWESQP